MTTKFPLKKGDEYECVQFVLKEDHFVAEEIKLKKIKKEVIHYSLKKQNQNDEIVEHFTPRIFFDDSDQLIVRSRNVNEGIKFVIKLLNYINKGDAKFKSYPSKDLIDQVSISMSFNILMMQQALVKIGLNALMHYYPETKYNPLLKPAKRFARFGEYIRSRLDNKIPKLDYKKDNHSILFYQLNEGLMIRSGLFGGSLSYLFLIENLFLFKKEGELSGLKVEFKKSKQIHYIIDEFLINIMI